MSQRSRQTLSFAAGRQGWLLLFCLLAGAVLAPAVHAQTSPNNDSINAIELEGNFGSITSSIQVGDSSQTVAMPPPAEPDHAGASGGKSVWYYWRAPVTGNVTFSTHSSQTSFNSVLAVYTASSFPLTVPYFPTFGPLSATIASNNDVVPGGPAAGSYVRFNANAGTTYFIAVDIQTSDNSSPRNFQLSWGPSPSNDDFAAAQNLGSATLGFVQGDTTLYSFESGEPASGNVTTPRHSAWFAWTAPANGPVTFSTDAGTALTTFNTTLAAFTGASLGTLVAVDADDNSGLNNSSIINFDAVAGVTYYIALDGVNNTTGLFAMYWSQGSATGPSNDNFANAQLLTGSGGTRFSNNFSSTAETGEPAHAGFAAAATVWYRWLAPSTGKAVFSTYTPTGETTFDTVLAVYRGSSVTNLTLIAANDNFTAQLSPQSFVEIEAVAGQVYYLAVGGRTASSTGFFRLGYSLAGYAGTFGFTHSIYEANESEGLAPANSPMRPHNIPGARITITRRDGYVGRVRVKYRVLDTATATNGIHYTFPAGDGTTLDTAGGFSFNTYTNSVIFDDWQTSASFLIVPVNNGATSSMDFNQASDPTVGLSIVSVTPVTGESAIIIPPAVDVFRTTSRLEIYDDDTLANFEKVRLQVSESRPSALVRVYRRTNPPDNITRYEINGARRAFRNSPSNATTPNNNAFPLAAGSDYAYPSGAQQDFTAVSGTINWNSAGVRFDIDIPINADSLVEFNEDFRIELWNNLAAGEPRSYGQSGHCYVTIVADDDVTAEQASGAVDASYNRDYYNLTTPPFNPTPGANDMVHAVAVDSNQRAIVGGDFTSVNSDNNYPRLVRMSSSGAIDPSFVVGSGPNSSVLAIKASGTNVFIAGKFTSYNSVQRKGVAKLLPTGALDTAFNPQAAISDPFTTPVRAIDVYPAGTNSESGKVIVAGDFTQFNGVQLNRIARLNADGSLDTSSFNPNGGADGPIYAVKIITGLTPELEGKILVAGDFTTFGGVPRKRIVRLNPNGSVDLSFNPGSGADGTVYAVDYTSDGGVIIGGAFGVVDLRSRSRVARLTSTGALDVNFDIGSGADDLVYSVLVDPSTGRILLGGLFRSFNQVRRAGMARLLSNGFLDTEFMEIAYNHYAGLHMRYSVYAEAKPFVRSMALQADGNVIIGGSFQRIGGGHRNTVAEGQSPTPSLLSPWRNGFDQPIVTPPWQNRDDIRNRYNFARVIGGSVPGPGNIGFTQSNYAVDEKGGQFFVTVSRDNTANPALSEAYASFATFDIAPGPGAAVGGLDYGTTNSLPRWQSDWPGSNNNRMVSEADTGANNSVLGTTRVYVSVVDDDLIEGDESFEIRLTSPKPDISLGGTQVVRYWSATTLEGEIIPVGVALGRTTALVDVIDDDFEPTYVSFSKTKYNVTENGVQAVIEVVRTGSTARSVSVDYLATEHLGATAPFPYVELEEAASAGQDFTGVFGRLTFGPGQTTATFTVPISDDVTAEGDESINLYLLNLSQSSSFGTSSQPVGSADTGSDEITAIAHGLYNDSQVRFSTTSGSLPGGLTAGVDYYVIVKDRDTFQVSTSPGGTAVNLTSGAVGTVLIEALGNLSRLDIYDNDFAAGTFRFSTTTKYTTTENGGSVVVTVERTGGNVGQVAVDLNTIDGTALAGVDYTAVATTLVWNSLDTTAKTVTIPILDDQDADAIPVDKDFTVDLSNARRVSGSGIPPQIGGVTPIPVVIQENDRFGVLGFALSQFTVSEAGGNALITVIRTNGVANQVQAKYATIPSGTARPVYLFDASSTSVVDDATDRLLIVRHGLSNGELVRFTSGTPPTGTLLNTDYLVANATTDDFQLREVNNGTILLISPAGASDTCQLNAYFAFDANNAVAASEISYPGHPFQNGDQVAFTSVVGAIPSPLVSGRTYYVINRDSDSFQVAATVNGAVIAITPSSVVTPSGSAYCVIHAADHYYVHTTGSLILDPLVTSTNFPVQIIDNFYQNPRVNSTFNRTVNLELFDIVDDGGGLAASTLLIVDDENINEPAGSLDTTFNSAAGPNGFVYALALLSDERLIIGGEFTSVNGLTSGRLARLTTSGELDSGFNVGSGANDTVRSIVVQDDGRMLLGGLFTDYNGLSRSRIARVNIDGSLDTSFDPGSGANNPVYALGLIRSGALKGRVLVGGSFSTMGGFARPYIARLQTNGVVDQSFSTGTGPNGTVFALAVQDDGKVVIGGDFTTVDMKSSPYLARLNLDGSLDTNFTAAIVTNVQLNASVRSLVIQGDGKIVVGGYFTRTNLSGGTEQFITRLNIDGTVDTNFDPQGGGDTPVLALALQLDGKILAGGDFQTFSGVTRRRLTRLNPDGTKDVNINFGGGANNFISAILVQSSNGRIVVGGGFTEFDSQPKNYLARIYGGVLGGRGALEFSLPVINVSEGQTNLLVTVRRTGGTEGTIRANYFSRAGSAQEDIDYLAISVTNVVEFPPGETEVQVPVVLIPDSLPEGTETLDLVLSALDTSDPFYAPLGNQPETLINVLDNDSEIAFGQLQMSVSESEATGQLLIPIIRAFALDGTVTVRLVSSNFTATAGSDFIGLNQLVTFQPGETIRNIPVNILSDVIEEGNEIFYLRLEKNPLDPDGRISTNAFQTEISIIDDDFFPGTVQFSSALYTVDENTGFAVLTVVRTNGSSGLITVNYNTADVNDAVGGTDGNSPNDFIHTNGSVAFADGETVKTVRVPILPDSDTLETNEIFQVLLSSATGGASLGFPNPATVSIVNNNSAVFGTFHLQVANTISEGDPALLVSVVLSNRMTNATVYVDYDTLPLTAGTNDFTPTSGQLEFLDGVSSNGFLVQILDDGLVESNELFQLVLRNAQPSGGPSIGHGVTNVTIVSTNQLPGTVVFKQAQYTADEGAGTLQVVLSRTNGYTGAVAVDVTLSDLQAKGYVSGSPSGFDYTNSTAGGPIIVTWADGDINDKTVSISLINDSVVEADEGFLVTLSNPINAVLSDVTTALAVILDDELKAGAIDPVFTAGANGPVLSLSIRPGASLGDITLGGDFTAVDALVRTNVAQISIDGTAYTGFDPGSITLGGTSAVVRAVAVYTNGNNVGKVLIAGRFDSINGVTRNNIARLNNDGSLDSSFDPGLGANAPVNALVIQADGRILIAGDFNRYDISDRNFVARILDSGSIDTTFDPLAGANGPVNALALQSDGRILVGGDFAQFNGVSSPKLARLLTSGALDTSFSTALGAGFNGAVFALAVQSDDRILVGGAFTLFHTNSAPRLTRLNSSGSIDSTGFTGLGAGFNDSVFAIALQNDRKILVGGNFTSFQGVPQNRIIRLTTTGARDTTMNFGSGADSFVSSIVLQSDNKVVVGGGFQHFDDQVRPYIARLNNGTNTGSGVLQFSTTDFPVYENGGSVTLTVKRILGTANPLSVEVAFVDGTAFAGTNYLLPTVRKLDFAEGEAVKTLVVNIPDDPDGAVTNSVRQFTVRLVNATNHVTGAVTDIISSRDTATVSIIDNETVIGFQTSSFVIAENGLNAVIVMTRSGGSNDPVTVRFETTVGTATENLDYLSVTNDIIWLGNDTSPKTILVPVLEDNLVEGIETVSMQLLGYGGPVLPGVTNSVLSILDNDFSSGVIAFESSTYNVIEGQPADIVVVRTNGSSGIVSAMLTVNNGTALAGSDYLSTNILVTFANGESRKVVQINTKDDAVQDDGENFFIHLGNASGGAVIGLADATVVIDDNDVTIGFAAASLNVTESNTTLLLDVTRSGLDNRTFIVDYATANISAQAGLDYEQTNGVIVFGPNEFSKVVAVTVKDDFIIEGPESFRVTLSGTNLSLLGFTQTTVNIDDNDLATDLEVLVTVNNPVKTNTTVRYTLLVTNYGPSDISGVTLTNILPSSLQLQSVSVTNVTTNGNSLIFDLPVLPKASGYLVQIEALDTNGVIRSVTNVAAIGIPAATNDLNLANNTVTNVTGLRGPGPYLAVESLSINSETPGPANGAFDINEQVSVNITFRNLGDVATTSAAASLLGTGGVVTNSGPQNATLGALAPNASAVRTFNFTVTGTNGGALTLTFNLTDTAAVVYDPAVLRYRLGGSTAAGSTNQITINATGDATPYPSTIVVSGLVGILDQLSLTLSNVTHTYPDDIDMLLVSPAGQGVIVMGDAGGDRSLNNVTFTINSQASTALPDNAQIVNSGSYLPANYAAPDGDVFGAPAPAGPYFSSLSAFRGIDPNGQWHLFVRDDTTGDFGVISNGWSLNIKTVFPANPTASLVIAGTQTAGPLLVGADQTYVLLVTNRGPATVGSAFVTNTFSSGFTFVSASNSAGGAVTQTSGRVVLAQGTLLNGAVVTNYITVRPSTAGNFTNVASVGSASGETDPFLGDNTLVFSQTVGANADLAVGVTTSPSGTVALGNNLTYSISLTNLGPSTATSVVLSDTLPAGVNYVSGSASQGVVSRSGSLVTASLGSLAVNATAQLTIVVTPTSAGSLTNSVTASSAVADAVAANNTALTTTTAVTDSADLQISLTGTPDPVTVGGNITYSISVTNHGSSTATSVVVTNPLPGSVTLVSFNTPQGTASNVSGAVVFNLGSVPTGTNITMQVIVTANVAGAVNNTAFVTAGGTFDAVSANNSATLAIAVQSPSADIDLGASILLTESISPANGAIDPGEAVTLRLELVNKGAVATGNLVATLLPTGGVVTNSGPQVKTYGAISSGGSAAQNFTFTANGNLGDTLSVTLQLQDGAANLGTVTFTYQLGATSATGSSTTINGVDAGAALTYPSTITVSGVAGSILKATVTLSNVTHTFPDDMDILLVSPSGQKILLVSDMGGGFAMSGVTITLDDNASTSLPDSGTISDGVYKPSNYLNSPVDPQSTNDVFAAPAPAGPYAAKLAELVDTNPNGQWSLYVMDDQAGNVGTISGWSLSLVTVATVSPSADLVLAMTASPEPVSARSNLTYTLTVTNRGPNGVSGVTVNDTLPTDAAVVSLAATQGTIVTNGAGAVIWTIGVMPANAQYQATIVISPDLPGTITNTATVAHTDIELNASNNSASAVSTVNGFVLSGGSVTVSPGNVSLLLVGQPNVTYVIEASTNLVDWVVISTQSSADGIITINDPAGSSNSLRFYRARQQ